MRVRRKGLGAWMGFLALVMSGCATVPHQLTFADLQQRGESSGLEIRRVAGDLFTLASLMPPQPHSDVLRVYIEGDGLAWRTRRRLSAHPSPVNPTALNLMLADPTLDKAYLARPCQYLQTGSCHPRYWSTHPFSEAVIAEMDRALDTLKGRGGYDRLELIGFSGGGAVAALLSARRNDIDRLVTVAGNLDTEAFCHLHGLTPLSASLNPADLAGKLAHIPQHHFIGKGDRVIPERVYSSFASHMTSLSAVSPVIVDHVTHQQGWAIQWPGLLEDQGLLRSREPAE
ncbi:hypothetical protein [Desulfoluna sp.]|uniref:hypothetical protein n=1 Tax=Desulfoluna sp. TaxID=2045199 RepID=UPI00260751CD|nr:hypothetical protein [Desulfoluna sp.]